jgi:hypothetical protein
LLLLNLWTASLLWALNLPQGLAHSTLLVLQAEPLFGSWEQHRLQK